MSTDKDTQKINADETVVIREHLETSKQRARVYREWAYFAIAVLIAIALIVALRSWKNGNDMAGALNARAIGVLDKFDTKVDSLDLAKLNAIADSVKSRVDALEPTQTALTKLTDQVRTEMVLDSSELRARLRTLDTVLISLRGVGDETRAQVKQNGDAATKAIKGIGTLEEKLTATVADADSAVKIHSGEFTTTLASINNRINDQRIDTFMTTLAGTGGNVEKITANLALISGNFEKASKEAPEIAALWKKMMQTSSKYQKYLIIARIIGLVGPVFGPLVP